MKYGHAKRLRALIEQLATTLSDTEALTGIELFPLWAAGSEYTVGERIRYDGVLYKCIQAHTAQEDWTPDDAVSLWAQIDDPSEEFPAWRQPQGAHDAYMTGDKVSYMERHWVSIMDYNIYEPNIYGWDEVL